MNRTGRIVSAYSALAAFVLMFFSGGTGLYAQTTDVESILQGINSGQYSTMYRETDNSADEADEAAAEAMREAKKEAVMNILKGVGKEAATAAGLSVASQLIGSALNSMGIGVTEVSDGNILAQMIKGEKVQMEQWAQDYLALLRQGEAMANTSGLMGKTYNASQIVMMFLDPTGKAKVAQLYNSITSVVNAYQMFGTALETVAVVYSNETGPISSNRANTTYNLIQASKFLVTNFSTNLKFLYNSLFKSEGLSKQERIDMFDKIIEESNETASLISTAAKLILETNMKSAAASGNVAALNAASSYNASTSKLKMMSTVDALAVAERAADNSKQEANSSGDTKQSDNKAEVIYSGAGNALKDASATSLSLYQLAARIIDLVSVIAGILVIVFIPFAYMRRTNGEVHSQDAIYKVFAGTLIILMILQVVKMLIPAGTL